MYGLSYFSFYLFLIQPLFISYVQIQRNNILLNFSWKNVLIIGTTIVSGIILYFIGIGMDFDNTKHYNKFGLLLIKHSVNVLNGMMKIDVRKNEGTEVKIFMPIAEKRKNK